MSDASASINPNADDSYSRYANTACVCYVMPPYMAEHLRKHTKDKKKLSALDSLERSANLMRSMRNAALSAPTFERNGGVQPPPKLLRRVYDCNHSTDLLFNQARREGDPASTDQAVNQAYDATGIAFEFFSKVYGRSSLDNNNLALTSSVHFQEMPDVGYDNAFWNGLQMVYGDGSIYKPLPEFLDVIAHELTHGITQFETSMRYENQSGALSEHFSDVFGVLVRQWANKENNPKTADWTLGKGIYRKASMAGMSLRDLSKPGKAYKDPEVGQDPQPAHMKNYVTMANNAAGDHGGVHINSGIPNRAFHLAATALGKPAWEVAGKIWYATLTQPLPDNADFKKCAFETIAVAGKLFGAKEVKAVRKAWEKVGVIAVGEEAID